MREHIQVLLATMLVLIVGYVSYIAIFDAEEVASLTIVRSLGEVTLVDALGKASPAVIGTALDVRDTISVGEDGSARISMGQDMHLSLEAASTIRVVEVAATGVRVELEDGRVQAVVRPGAPSLGINSQGRAVTATNATFNVSTDGEGGLGVEPLEGSVELQGFDERTTLEAGQRLTTISGGAPVVEPIPEALLLNVTWPEEGTTREPDLALLGRTDPYANVDVSSENQATQVRAGPDGYFRASIPLGEGKNKVRVTTTDILGKQKALEEMIIRDSTAPSATSSEVVWGR